MPDKLLTLFIHVVSQNKGILSKNKRNEYFSMLSDAEIEAMQAIVKEHLCP